MIYIYNVNMTYKEKTQTLVEQISSKLNIKNQFADLETYVNLINEKNKVMNLTGFKGDVLWEKGIYESISMMYQMLEDTNFIDKKLLDIGAGVGFPSLPFKIICPNFSLTIHEANKKRFDFLNDVRQELNLDMNVLLVRTEDVKRTEIFDIVTARALGSTRILAEISSRVLKIQGSGFYLKGPALEEEINEAKYIFHQLNYSHSIIQNNDKNIKSQLVLLKLTKLKPTPKTYPRDWALIKNNS